MTDKPTPTDAELFGVIREAARGGAVRRDGSTSLRIARADLAKWGAPATGGEPAGTVGYTVHGTQYVNWRTKPPAHGTPLYTTPQPTQAQAASSAVLKAIREANMQLVRTGDDAFMLVPYKAANAQAADSVTAPAPPPECETEAEKRAFAFGWFKALESERMKAESVQEDAARWREHVGKLDALVAYCPTCCQGFIAKQDMTRDEVLFACGKAVGQSGAKRLREALDLAVDHIDMDALRISHCKDAAVIDAARKQGEKQ